jgi:hypothetical protein
VASRVGFLHWHEHGGIDWVGGGLCDFLTKEESGTPKSISQEKELVALIGDAIVLSSRFGAQW